jgi:hypothetical protein
MLALCFGSVITLGLPPAKVKALAVTNQLSFTHRKGPKRGPRVTKIKKRKQKKGSQIDVDR